MKTLLLVEDEAVIAMNEAAVLRKNGFDVVSVHSGEQAVEMINDRAVDLILMDIDLGRNRMDGTEAAEIILSRHDIPLIFLSSYVEPEIVSKTEGITSYGYVVKRAGETVLIAAIKMAFRLYDARVQEKNKEAALRESEERFRSIYQHMEVGVAEVSLEFYILGANQAYCRMLGYSEEELIGMHLKDITHPEILDRNLNLQARLARGEIDHYRLEKKFIHRSGRIINGILDANLVRNADGQPAYFLGSVLDITDRIEMETALRESERKFRDIFDNISDSIFIHDTRGRFLEVNDTACRNLGYSREELIGMSAFDIDGNQTAFHVPIQIGNFPAGGVKIFESLHVRKDGVRVPVEINSRGLTYKGSECILSVSRDITDRLAAERKIRENEQKLHAIFDSVSDCIFLKDRELKYLHVNPAVEKLFGQPIEQIIGKRDADFFPPGNADEIEAVDRRVLQGQTIEKQQINYINGLPRTFYAKKTPVLDGDGNITGVCGIARDITEWIELQSGYSQILMTVTDGFCIIDNQGRISEANQAFGRMTGYTPEEVGKLSIKDFDTDRSGGQGLSVYLSALRKRSTELFQSRIRCKNGESMVVEVSASYMPSQNGRIVVFLRDITERERQKHNRKTAYTLLGHISSQIGIIELIEKSSGILRNYLGCSAVGIRIRKDGGHPYYEMRSSPPGFVVTYGDLCVTGDEMGNCICGRILRGAGGFITGNLSALPPTADMNPGGRENRNKCLEAGFESLVILPLNFGDEIVGLLQCSDTRPDYFHQGHMEFLEKIAAHLAVGIAQRTSRIALEKSEKRYRMLVENANDTVIMISEEGELMLINPAATRLLGRSVEECIGKKLDELLPAGSSEELLKTAREIIRSGVPRTLEVSLPLPGGTRWFHANTQPIKDENGRYSSLLALSIDVSDRLETEAKLMRTIREKNNLMEELNHRVKNNLAMVSALIRFKDESLGEVADLSDIHSQLEAIRTVHDQLKITQNEIDIELGSYLNNLIDSVLNTSPLGGVKRRVEVPEVWLSAKNAVAIGLIVNELATNAVKHGFNGETAEFYLSFSPADDSGEHTLIVSNTGNPFPEEVDYNSQNTLGLRLVSALVQQLNGTFEISRKPVTQFTMKFALPLIRRRS